MENKQAGLLSVKLNRDHGSTCNRAPSEVLAHLWRPNQLKICSSYLLSCLKCPVCVLHV